MSVRLQEPDQPGASASARPSRRGAWTQWWAARRAGWAAVAGPAVLATILSLLAITGRNLGFDEGATVSIASQHGSALWSAIAHDGGNMSGYYLLVHGLIGLFGNGLFVLRMVSVIAVVATVALIAAIAGRLFGALVAGTAGVLAAVSLPLVYWAQTARGYAPMVAFVCAGFLAFIALADPPAGRAPSRRPWFAYVVTMTLAMYCSFVAVLVVPAQLLVLAHRRDALRRWLAALAALAVLCVPLAVLAVRRGSGQLFWVPRPTRMVETQVLQSLTSAGLTPNFHKVATTTVVMWATVAAVAALVIDTIRRQRRGEQMWGMALTLSWCIVPAALTFLYSFVSQPIFVPRNLIMSTPAVGLALATVVARRRWPRWAVPAVLLAVAAVVAVRAIPVGNAYGVSPEPWQRVTDQILAEARPGDCIAFYPLDARMAFQYYVGTGRAAVSRAPRSILPVIPWGVVRPYVEDYATLSPAQLARRAAGCRRLWFVSSHEGQPNGPAGARAHRAQWFALGAELARMFGSGPVRKFGYASVIHVQLMPRRGARASGT
ncbi:MAG TPA: glycosyltransferase family 39 protein [Solirubrobacteraceae bacterium]|jgi:mannosyltransferase|nr:glycosyltransferase family 39 protein [Solirubrobacteraceae bacterium]